MSIGMTTGLALERVGHEPGSCDTELARVTVCICTYRRRSLARLLEALRHQQTGGRFEYSIVVADNDAAQSAKEIAVSFRERHGMNITYCVEPERNIALARNASVARATGDFVAFIDDDEIPPPAWLETLVRACTEHGADGVLGPVRPYFDVPPPSWVIRSRVCERQEYPTGQVLHWRQTRTGNALIRRSILEPSEPPFRGEFRDGGEDDDFFRRMMERGHTFVWCNEAAVHEVVPPERYTRKYFIRRALLRGQNQRMFLTGASLVRSLLALAAYTAALPVALVRGQHVFMPLVVRMMDHVGKLCISVGYRPVRGDYLDG